LSTIIGTPWATRRDGATRRPWTYGKQIIFICNSIMLYVRALLVTLAVVGQEGPKGVKVMKALLEKGYVT